MVFKILYLIVTFIYPLNRTYQDLKLECNARQEQIWAIYWTFYAFLFLLKSYLPFINM